LGIFDRWAGPGVEEIPLADVAPNLSDDLLGAGGLLGIGLGRYLFGLHRAELLFDDLKSLFDLNISSDDERHVVGNVVCLHPIEKVLTGQLAQTISKPDDGQLVRVHCIEILAHGEERKRAGVVGTLILLAQHDLFLAGDLLVGEARVLSNVSDDIESKFGVLAGQDNIVMGEVVGRGGVGAAAEGFDLLINAAGALLCALEEHVLKKMGNPGDLSGLVEAAHVDPDVNSGDAGAGLGDDQDFQAVLEGELLHVGLGERAWERPSNEDGEQETKHERAFHSSLLEAILYSVTYLWASALLTRASGVL